MSTFLILKLPRTGSTMLGRALDAHPSVECVDEFLNEHQDRGRREKVEALAAFYRDAARADGVAVGQTMNPIKYELTAGDIAAALVPGSTGWLRRRRAVREPLPVRLVVLRRENLLKQAVSELLARQRGDFHASRDLVDDPSVLEGQVLDVEQVARRVASLGSRSRRLGDLADALRAETLHITYEQLQQDLAGTVDSVFVHIGAPVPPAGFDHSAGFTKMLSDDLSAVIANYDDIVRDPRLQAYV